MAQPHHSWRFHRRGLHHDHCDPQQLPKNRQKIEDRTQSERDIPPADDFSNGNFTTGPGARIGTLHIRFLSGVNQTKFDNRIRTLKKEKINHGYKRKKI